VQGLLTGFENHSRNLTVAPTQMAIIAVCKAAPVIEPSKHALDQTAPLVDFGVASDWRRAV
jgi:hypothetical protein